MSEQPLVGRTALVTGGTSGIGLAVARRLARDGARLVIVAREAPIHRANKLLGACCAPPLLFEADIGRRDQLEGVRAALERSAVELSIVVANAGVARRDDAIESPDEDVRLMLDTNLYGSFVTLQVFVPMVARRPGGRVVVTSSVTAIHGMRRRALYSATKAALSGLVRSLAIEWGELGVSVNAVGPGIIRTPLLRPYVAAYPERVAAAIAATPLRRLGEPEDVASVVAFLASDAAAFITGQTLFVDGGISAGDAWW
ncbi:MAG TPA: SDR family NAD(P)-dependent oxidoreductase [Candidatus Saccharimonadales bacterium]|nr:SDR family NAD(P)-dependent oxidoreductase [Candidatus Saccharimonadales bacterium]